MVPADPSQQLDKMSRLNFGKPTPVEHNLRVHYIGDIHRDHLHRLMRYYDEENNGNRNSSASQDPRALIRRSSNSPYPSTSLPRSIPEGYSASYESERAGRRRPSGSQSFIQDSMATNVVGPEVQQGFRERSDTVLT